MAQAGDLYDWVQITWQFCYLLTLLLSETLGNDYMPSCCTPNVIVGYVFISELQVEITLQLQ